MSCLDARDPSIARVPRQSLVDRLAQGHGRGHRGGVLLGGAGGFQRRLEVEAVDLERGGDLLRDEVEGDLLGGAGVVSGPDGDRPGLADPVEPAARLAVGGRREVHLVPEPDGEGDEVVEARADGVRVDEEDLDVAGEDVIVDPGLAPGGRDLAGVEPGGAGGDVAELAQEAARQGIGPGVAQEDERPLAAGETALDLAGEPTLLGGAPDRGEGPAGRDELAPELLGVAQLERLKVARAAVEVGGELDQGPEEPPGAIGVAAVGADTAEQVLLEPAVLVKEARRERVAGGDLDGSRPLGQGRQLAFEVLLVDEDRGRQEVAQDEGGHHPWGLADRAPVAELAVGVPAEGAIGGAVVLAQDLAVAVAVDEGGSLGAVELLAEARREGPEVGEEGARVAAHEAAGEDDRRHAGKAGEPMGGLRLRRGRVVVLVGLVKADQTEVAGVALQDPAGERVAARVGDGLVERLAAPLSLGPGGRRVQGLEDAAQGLQVDRRRSGGALGLLGKGVGRRGGFGRPVRGRRIEDGLAGAPGQVIQDGDLEIAEPMELERSAGPAGPATADRPGGEARHQGIGRERGGEESRQGDGEAGRLVRRAPRCRLAGETPRSRGRGRLGELLAAAGAAARDALPGVAELGGLAGEDGEVGGSVEVGQGREDLDAGAGQDGGGLVAPALQEMRMLCGALDYAELWPAQAWYQAAPDRHCA
jgi:hypothetical protein